MEISTYTEKLNKVDGNVYVIEEEISLIDGVYDAPLAHDNVNTSTLAVYTGPKLTGDRIQSYVLSTPSLMPWKKVIRLYADVPTVYISYETEGDTVEAEDVNLLQQDIIRTQEGVNAEEDRAEAEESFLKGEIAKETARATAAEKTLTDNLTAEVTRAKGAEKTLTDNLVAEVTRAKAAEKTNSDSVSAEVSRAKAKEAELQGNITAEVSRATAAENDIRSTISTNKPNWDDKYTRNEVDNKFSALETAIDWKEAVATFADLATTYPQPDDGWTVNVKDTDYTYRWSGTAWIAISANAIPKATQSVDGLLSKEDKTAYDDTNAKKHTHSNKSTLDKLTEALLANWSDAYNKRHEHGNKTVIDKITQTLLDNWNAAYTHIGNKSNPHGVTKAQVGLGSVPNVATNDQTPTFTQASALGNLSSGEKLTISLGKIMKAIADFIAHKEDAVLHITTAERTNWNDANSKKHAHSNKSVIDGITQVLVDKWNSALTALPAHTHTKSQITDMPTKVSQFTNDAGYITQADVDASQSHTHSNKTVLDKITQSLLDTWNGKAGTSVATQAANGLMSAADKKKLDGVAAGANNYVHPSAHPASMITQDATHRFTSDTEKNGWNKFLFSAAITVPASGWSAEVPYTQTVSVSGLTSAMDVMLTLNITGSPTTDQVKVWKAALGMIDVGTTADGSVSFTCYSKKPAVDLPLYIKSV
ncbi:hypothetical protein CE91St54_13860 [Hungatella hathewayi]|uniref:Uncharacterized protein n=1 Tax=Hungatella hathewayi TaxID=154046 RepID=A0A413XDG1_9FIRM|nr:hypothetical protein [Hungatella hathewayi]RHB75248.1 hypothetical protein DW876_05020 [Hungatella hathewayi]GKG99454.1 hypothetical protein CE91St55_14360 [Hungatella hathewayi]GKH06278.1 hypothetical protein CE91St54_13860 [Hungatella hathewayi]